MERNYLLQLLNDYVPKDTQEQEYKRRTISFVTAHKDCFKRSLATGHITASAWLINNDSSRALLMHHAKLDRWFQLGGHCDGKSNVLAVAIKEAQEESGITGIEPVSTEIFDIDIHTIPESKEVPAHEHYDIRFLLRVNSDETIVQNSESKELRWINKEKCSLPTKERSVERMFNKWLALDEQ